MDWTKATPMLINSAFLQSAFSGVGCSAHLWRFGVDEASSSLKHESIDKASKPSTNHLNFYSNILRMPPNWGWPDIWVNQKPGGKSTGLILATSVTQKA